MRIGEDGRLVRDCDILHMNDYCRRAVAKGKQLAETSGGTLSVMTLGNPDAETVCREALVFGADFGIHICDEVFAGSDTYATAMVLGEAIRKLESESTMFDLILCGLNSLDADTGQVPPQLAELLDLPFAAGVRRLRLESEKLQLELEHDDERSIVNVELPAMLSCAERLCDPCKIKDPEIWAEADASLIRKISASDLESAKQRQASRQTGKQNSKQVRKWGQDASLTVVGKTRVFDCSRRGKVVDFTKDEADAVKQATLVCWERGSLPCDASRNPKQHDNTTTKTTDNTTGTLSGKAGKTFGKTTGETWSENSPIVAVIIEPNRIQLTQELLGGASQLASEIYGKVVALGTSLPSADDLGKWGAHHGVLLEGQSTDKQSGGTEDADQFATSGEPTEEDISIAVSDWLMTDPSRVWAILSPATIWGRQVASRIAVRHQAGLVGDAVALRVDENSRLIANKPAFGGQMVAEITCTSPIQMATVRQGVLSSLQNSDSSALLANSTASLEVLSWEPKHRVTVLSRTREDDSQELAHADVVVGIGQGIIPEDYPLLNELCEELGASLCATRKVTDQGWLPRARQVGITGHSISPSLYIAIGLSGNFNHTVGVRTSGTFLSINTDPEALIFKDSDLGILGDWKQVLPPLVKALKEAGQETS